MFYDVFHPARAHLQKNVPPECACSTINGYNNLLITRSPVTLRHQKIPPWICLRRISMSTQVNEFCWDSLQLQWLLPKVNCLLVHAEAIFLWERRSWFMHPHSTGVLQWSGLYPENFYWKKPFSYWALSLESAPIFKGLDALTWALKHGLYCKTLQSMSPLERYSLTAEWHHCLHIIHHDLVIIGIVFGRFMQRVLRRVCKCEAYSFFNLFSKIAHLLPYEITSSQCCNENIMDISCPSIVETFMLLLPIALVIL